MTGIAARILVSTVFLAPEATLAREWNFEMASPGRLPPHWTAAKTGQGAGSEWQVIPDPTAPTPGHVLAQTSSAGPMALFNLAVADDTLQQDLDLSVKFKAVQGTNDQGGGLVWRYQDADNYYVARVNPLEDNFRVYKVEKGKRTQLQTADVKVPAGEWHALRVMHRGNDIQCFLDGKRYLAASDDTFHTSGKIGLWTKSDAVTWFDDLSLAAPQ